MHACSSARAHWEGYMPVVQLSAHVHDGYIIFRVTKATAVIDPVHLRLPSR